jgi:ribosomal protein S18 acetylase RimI-like enzyme
VDARRYVQPPLPVTFDWIVRLARDADVRSIEQLIPLSVRGLKASHYSEAQVEAALGSVFGVDGQLICDGTYYVVETGGASSSERAAKSRRGGLPSIIGCGGWSKRKTLFGSDHQTDRNDAELDPARDSARIRAFFVHPAWARRGVATAILSQCERAIRASGFRSIELAATLPGVPFYAALGYATAESHDVPLGNNLSLAIVRMTKNL